MTAGFRRAQTMELTASPADGGLGKDESFQNLSYGADLFYTVLLERSKGKSRCRESVD